MSNVLLHQIQSSEDVILVSESTLRIEGLYASNISPVTDSHNLISISYSDFNVSDVNYHNSSLELMNVIFSTCSIQGINGNNITQLNNSNISLNYGLLIRSTTVTNFDDIRFQNILLSGSAFIEIINSDLLILRSHSINNTNTIIYNLKHVNLVNGEMVSVINSVSAFSIFESNVSLSYSSFTMLNSTISSALHSKSSNVSISNSTFDSNIAMNGAAMSLL